jgi:hypothetical protein
MMRLVPWPQSRYLARITSTNPAETIRIILAVPNTENTLVHSDLTDAALAMPPELAAEWGRRESSWVKAHASIDFLLPQKLVEFG